MEVKGANTVTISQGKIVYKDGKLMTEKGAGRYIDRPPFASYYDALKIKRAGEEPISSTANPAKPKRRDMDFV